MTSLFHCHRAYNEAVILQSPSHLLVSPGHHYFGVLKCCLMSVGVAKCCCDEVN